MRISGAGMLRVSVTVLAAFFLCAVLLAFVVPAGAAIGRAFAPLQTEAALQSVTADPGSRRVVSALLFTLTEALLSALVAILVGLPAAFFVARRNFPGRRFLLSLSGVPLCVPPAIIALAFVLFYGRQGYLNSFLMAVFHLEEPPVTFLYSLAGVVIAHGFYNFPVVLRTVSQVWSRLPESEEEAAFLLGAGRFRIFRTITLPRLSGAILSSGVLVFLYCFFSFIIVLLFGGVGGTTIEVELYRAARSSLDFHLAGTIAVVETVAALGIVFLYVYMQKRLVAETAGLSVFRSRLPVRGVKEKTALSLYLLFLTVFFLCPLASILLRSFVVTGHAFSDGTYRFALDAWISLAGRESFSASVWGTLSVAIAVAVVSTLAALFYAFMRFRFFPETGAVRPPILFRILPVSPLAVSSVMLGFGWTLVVPRGNVAVLILAQSAMAWPFAWAQIGSALDRIPSPIYSAATLLSRNPLDSFFRVQLPLAAGGIFSGAGFVFAISAGDASLPLLLSLPDFDNLSLMLFRLVGSYRFSEACACAVLLATLCAFVFFMQE